MTIATLWNPIDLVQYADFATALVVSEGPVKVLEPPSSAHERSPDLEKLAEELAFLRER